MNSNGTHKNESLVGGNEDNFLDGGFGDDTLLGGDVNDTLRGGEDNPTSGLEFETGVGNDLLIGGAGDDDLDGGYGNDTLVGGAGNDVLNGGDRDYRDNDFYDGVELYVVDSLVGGTGDDTYIVDSASDVVVENAGEGTDEVRSFVSLTLSANVENLVLIGEGALNGIGNGLANTLTGNDAANSLDGGAGVDSLVGGAGNDTYFVGDLSDAVYEVSGDGSGDLVVASVSGYTIGDEVEALLLGTGVIAGTGNGLANTLTGNALGNSLDGGYGIDTLIGGAGNDTYVVDNTADVIVENAAEGMDLVVAQVSGLKLDGNVEKLLLGDEAVSGFGNGLANTLTGNALGNSLDGGSGIDSLVGVAGDDTYFVDNLSDVIYEAPGEGSADLVVAIVSGYTLGREVEALALATGIISGTGNTLANTLTGNDAANSLDGGAGIDSLVGGAGNDTYVVDNNADSVVEAASGGTDVVQSSVGNFVLPENVEELQLTGTGANSGSGSGNTLANKITGNAAANTLYGGAGDTLIGNAGDDTLSVGAGLTSVSGGAGSDLLQIDWTSIAGGMLARSIQKVGSGAALSYKGSYAAKDSNGKVLTQVNFDGVEKLSLNGIPVNLDDASGAGVVANRLSTNAKTSETGDKVEYSVALNVAPKDNVTLHFQSNDPSEGRVLNPDITFTPANWDRPQKLVVQGVDDFENDGSIAYTISGRVVTKDLSYDRISVPSFALTNQEDTVDAPVTFDGTKGVDYFQGNNGNDRIYGDNGQDQLKGGRGNDRIYGENDNDRLYGELGEDELYGGYDDDTLDGGEGADSLFGEQGRDTLIGGAGNDYLDGGLLNDSMSGGAGNDTYLVDNANDVINDLGAPTDVDTVLVIQTISYTLPANVENAAINASGNANLTGNTLNNGLTGNDEKNVLDGGEGNDRLDGGAGADSLVGGVGNDVLIGGAGNDTFAGGAGVDLADFVAAGLDVNVNLGTSRVTGDGTDLIFDVENILSGEGNDTLLGNDSGNEFKAGSGDDSLNGGGGKDTLCGCAYGKDGGHYELDTLSGGTGMDVFQLGWESGRFYDDGNVKNAGKSDYVVITDFTVGQDRLQLDGGADGYYLAASGVAGVSGLGLYAEQGATDELLAIIKSANTTALTKANTISTAIFV